MYYLSFRDKVELEETGQTNTWGPNGEKVTLFSSFDEAVDSYKHHKVVKSKDANVWMVDLDEKSWAIVEAQGPTSALAGWSIIAGKLRKRLERIALHK